jgi:hypothetical protein
MSKEAKPKRDKAEANQEKLTKDLVDNLCSTIKGREVIWGAKQTGLVDSGLETAISFRATSRLRRRTLLSLVASVRWSSAARDARSPARYFDFQWQLGHAASCGPLQLSASFDTYEMTSG